MRMLIKRRERKGKKKRKEGVKEEKGRRQRRERKETKKKREGDKEEKGRRQRRERKRTKKGITIGVDERDV